MSRLDNAYIDFFLNRLPVTTAVEQLEENTLQSSFYAWLLGGARPTVAPPSLSQIDGDLGAPTRQKRASIEYTEDPEILSAPYDCNRPVRRLRSKAMLRSGKVYR